MGVHGKRRKKKVESEPSFPREIKGTRRAAAAAVVFVRV